MDGQTIDLAWTDNSAFEDGYEVQRCCQGGWVVVASLPADANKYRDGGLIVNTQYTYAVRAKKDEGYSPFSPYASAVTADAPPPVPSSVHAYPVSSSVVVIVWTDASTNEDGFRLERSADAGATWAIVSVTGPNQEYLNDDGRTSDEQVCYRVVAFNGRGESGPSPSACTAPPLAPNDLVATTVDEASIDLTWTDNSAVEDAYAVGYFAYDPFYEYFYEVARLPANSTTYRVTGLPSGTSYTFAVVAVKDDGYSDFSNSATGSTAGVTATGAPRAPAPRVIRRIPSTAHISSRH
jgi:titin